MAFLCQGSLTQGFYANLVDGRREGGGGLRIRPLDDSLYSVVNGGATVSNPGTGHAPGWAMTDSIAVREEDVSTKMKLRRTYKKLPCMFVCDAPWMVCDQFRDLVEQLEPNVHQFFPIDILDLKDKVVGQRFVLNICNRLDALDEHKSEISWWGKEGRLEGKPVSGSGYASIDPLGKLFVRKTVVQGHHFWGDNWLSGAGGRFFCSDEAQKAIRVSKLKMMRFTPVGET